jgi:poly-gamma-glutamate synthesis protein (capsule biosynthesis protein)
VRLINLETSITRHDGFAEGKGTHYRMSPGNLPCLTVFGPDVCTLANNHVLDFGRRGLADTLDALSGAGIRTSGAGHDLSEARPPAVVPVEQHNARVLVLAGGTASSGIPRDWAATHNESGVFLLPDLSEHTARALTDLIGAAKHPNDVSVVPFTGGRIGATTLPPTNAGSRTASSRPASTSSTATPLTTPDRSRSITTSSSCTAAAISSMTTRESTAMSNTAPTYA